MPSLLGSSVTDGRQEAGALSELHGLGSLGGPEFLVDVPTCVFTVGRPMPSWLPMAASVRYVGSRVRTRVSAGVRETVLRDAFLRGGFSWLVMVL